MDNALFANTRYVAEGSNVVVRGQHLTVNRADQFLLPPAGTTNGSLFLTNSILVNVTNGWGHYTAMTNNQTVLTNSSGVFQTLGTGAHYLSSDTYRNSGTTSISILADIRKRTTYPPIILTNNFTVSTNLFPQPMRDTDTPVSGGAKMVKNGRFEIPGWRFEILVYPPRRGQLLHSTMLSKSLPSRCPRMFLPRS